MFFGNENFHFRIPDLDNKDNLTGSDKKLIGEFIRRHHGRLGYEIAISGIKNKGSILQFGTSKLDNKNRRIAGIVARSHSMEIRDTFKYLEDLAHDSWRNPQGINAIYLMVVLRIADYIQIDSSRVNPFLLKLKTFSSPISQLEFETHLSIGSLNFNQPDSEKIYVDCDPITSEQFVKIKNLIYDIQSELDKSWASLGEVYGFIPQNKPSIKFRRITSNLENKNYLKKLSFVPEQITFKVDNNLSKLLVAPLYGNSPKYGVRELLQNAIDSCLEREIIEKNNIQTYQPEIILTIKRIDEQTSLFSITDNGKGMNDKEILNYFLNVGTSFRKSMDWKKKFTDDGGKSKVNRNGKFGIGVLASFLLGDKITVKTKSKIDNFTYCFTTSIDSEFINIKKDNSLQEYGAEISIVISENKRDELLDDYKGVDWTDWYVYEKPIIKFEVDGEFIKPNKKYYELHYHDFKTQDYESIKWTYSTLSRQYSFNSMIACNGIIITESYRPNDFEDSYNKIISKKPSLLVTDKEGIFPIKLDRNDIDCKQFPFEKELLEEVSKHYLAQLINLDIDIENISKNRMIHNAKLIFGSAGYTLSSDYFINGLNNKYNYIRILTNKSNIHIDLNNFKNQLIVFEFNKYIGLKSQTENVAPEGGARILLSQRNYNELFNETKRLRRHIKESAIIEQENSSHVLYTVRGFNEEPTLLKDINDINTELVSQTISIQEVSSTALDIHFGGEVLNKLFAKYIKSNFIIPYNRSDREKLFEEVFRDLKKYM
nr:ATP-binding protein [uncultured Flavobacterium sp.]